MIKFTIEIKTPKDYIKAFKDWVRQPRKDNAKEYVLFLDGVAQGQIVTEFEKYSKESEESKEQMIKDLADIACKCIAEATKETEHLINKTARLL